MLKFPQLLCLPRRHVGQQISALGGWPTVSGGFFYCPDEPIDHRDRRQKMLECGQIIRKVTDQRRSAIRAGPTGSDKAAYVNVGIRAGTALSGVAPHPWPHGPPSIATIPPPAKRRYRQ